MNNHLTGLENINRPVESWDDLMVYIITSKLDPDTLNKWNQKAPIDRLPTLSELLNFLKRRCQILESNLSSVSLPGGASTSRAIGPKRVQRTTRSLSHCGKGHHSLLLFERPQVENYTASKHNQINETNHIEPAGTANLNMSDQAQPKNFAAVKTQHRERNILAPAIVYIILKYNQRFPCRVLLDGGSQINMISERMIHMTGLKRQYAPIQFQCANKTVGTSNFKCITIESLLKPFSVTLDAHIVHQISGTFPKAEIDILDWNIPEHIPLADEYFNIPQRVDEYRRVGRAKIRTLCYKASLYDILRKEKPGQDEQWSRDFQLSCIAKGKVSGTATSARITTCQSTNEAFQQQPASPMEKCIVAMQSLYVSQNITPPSTLTLP
uniref:DUF1758 domain-containing protein n=1 Tax=Glossina austeni TaxID=7395 RepID=A0A1A9VVW1_GLOAU